MAAQLVRDSVTACDKSHYVTIPDLDLKRDKRDSPPLGASHMSRLGAADGVLSGGVAQGSPDLSAFGAPEDSAKAPACCSAWSFLPPIYANQLAIIAHRTPCRCTKRQPPRKWGKVVRQADLGPPAQKLGTTIVGAATAYLLPVQAVRRAYIVGLTSGQKPYPVGKRDAWDVWFALPSELKAVFGKTPSKPPATATAAHARVWEKLADLEAEINRLGGDAP